MHKGLESAVNAIFSKFLSAVGDGKVDYYDVFAGFMKDFTFKSLLLCAEAKFNLVDIAEKNRHQNINLVDTDEKNRDTTIGKVINWCIGRLLLNSYLRYFVNYNGSLMYAKLPPETSYRPFSDILQVLTAFTSKKMDGSDSASTKIIESKTNDDVDIKTVEYDEDTKENEHYRGKERNANVVLIRINSKSDSFTFQNDIVSKCSQFDEKLQLVCQYTSHLDDKVGKIVSMLKKTENWENSIVLVLVDFGADLSLGSCNYPLRCGKNSYFEGNLNSFAMSMLMDIFVVLWCWADVCCDFDCGLCVVSLCLSALCVCYVCCFVACACSVVFDFFASG